MIIMVTAHSTVSAGAAGEASASSAASWACGSLVEQVLAVGHDRPDAVVVDVHEGPNVLMIHVGGMVKAGPPCVVATTKFA